MLGLVTRDAANSVMKLQADMNITSQIVREG